MKVTVTIDCSPEEARAFMGFPDFGGLQQQMMQAMQDQFRQQMSSDPETAMKSWFGSMSDLQKAYWQPFAKSGGKPE